jgi:hypothetical protein
MRESRATQERRSLSCYHGGEFFTVIGESFDHPERRHDVVNADVLDAWFPPTRSATCGRVFAGAK